MAKNNTTKKKVEKKVVKSPAVIFTQAELKKLKNLLSEEKNYKKDEREAKLQNMLRAFRIGKILYWKISKAEVAGCKYGNRVVNTFVEKVGKKYNITTQQSAYLYIHLYQGALYNEDIIRNYPFLSREYFQTLGTHRWENSILTQSMYYKLLLNPVVTRKKSGGIKANSEMVNEIKELMTFYENIISRMGMEYFIKGVKFDFESFKPDAKEIWRFPPPKKGDKEKAEHVFKLISNFYEDATRLTGWKYRPQLRASWKGRNKVGIPEPDLIDYKKIEPLSVQGIIFARKKDMHVREGLAFSSPFSKTTIADKVLKGDCRKVLLDKEKFPQRCLDMVLTDPPFGKEAYTHGWRHYSAVRHRAKKTVKEQAEEVADIARIILENKINKEQFCWYQFFPINYAHEIITPLVQVFAECVGEKFKMDILIWNKKAAAKVGTTKEYVHQLEGIIYVTIDKSLDKKDADGERIGYATPLFNHAIPSNARKEYFWKPPALLKDIIQHSTYESDDPKEQMKQCILDPYAGRGSLGVACLEIGRDFRLIEIDDDQYRHCKSEIHRAVKNLGLDKTITAKTKRKK